jgi:uncharacterized protein YehS (DUF1456 family)
MKRVGLELSPDFTLEDIRKIRDYDGEMTKDMTREEVHAYYRECCGESLRWYYKALAEVQAGRQNMAADPQLEYKRKSA